MRIVVIADIPREADVAPVVTVRLDPADLQPEVAEFKEMKESPEGQEGVVLSDAAMAILAARERAIDGNPDDEESN